MWSPIPKGPAARDGKPVPCACPVMRGVEGAAPYDGVGNTCGGGKPPPYGMESVTP